AKKSEALAQKSDALTRTSGELAQKSDALTRTSGELAQKSDALTRTSGELAQKSDALTKTADELARRNDQLARTSDELQQKANELQRKSDQLAAKNDELSRKADAARATGAEAARAKAELARLQAELRALDAERKAAAKQARSDEEAAAEQSAGERARLERERHELEQQLSGERAALQKKVAAAQGEIARVAGEQQRKQAALLKAQAELATAQAEMQRLVAEQDKKRAEGAALDGRLAAARAELARIEAETQRRLAMVPTPAKVAAATPPAAKQKDALPTEKLAPPVPVAKGEPTTRVRDVRFADDADAERVIVDVGSKGTEATIVRADERGAVLKIARASLPKKLERTLDASAFAGPIRSVSTYADPDDAGAVRVEVALADGAPHAQPKLVRNDGTLTWEFPRAATQNVAPPKVAGYAAPVPLQMAPAAGAAAGSGRRPRHVYTGRRMELDLVNGDIHNIMRLLADVGQVNIVLADDVKGTVTMHLKDVPWDQALDIIAKSKGLGIQREGNLIRVAPQAVLEKELEQEVARQKAAVELKPLETRLIPLSYADGTQILPRITEVMSPRGHVSVDGRTNQLIVTDVAGNIALAEDLVNHLDTQTPQVLIEARIVEARTTFTRDIGIQWGGNTINSAATGNPTGIAFPSTVGVAGGATDAVTNTQGLQLGASGAASPNFVVNMPAAVGTGSGGALGLTLGSLNGAVNINLRLSSLENTGNVRIISAPKIMTLDNIEASIEQGVAIPISVVSAAGANTVFVDAKLNLTVKPHVTNEGSIVMNVNITRNEPDFVNVGARGDPTILKKQAKTEMLVRDGDTAVIGGIYTRNTGLSYTKVPWFADIPILGWLFKNRRENDDRTELLIFITPRIVNRAVVAR
ncbi:MAG TPA: type IV pilus secretin PilQ, partial [Polyangia bacterium]